MDFNSRAQQYSKYASQLGQLPNGINKPKFIELKHSALGKSLEISKIFTCLKKTVFCLFCF